MSGFIKDYTIWKYHGEIDAPLWWIIHWMKSYRTRSLKELYAHVDSDDGVGHDDAIGAFHCGDIDDGPIDGGTSEDELDNSDFLS